MSTEQTTSGLWSVLQKIFIVYFLIMAIKMVYVDAPKAFYRYFFVPVGTFNEPEGVRLFLINIAYYISFLAIFFVFSIIGLAPFAAFALLVCWTTIPVYEAVRSNRATYADAPTRFKLIVVFCAKALIAFGIFVASLGLYLVHIALSEIFPSIPAFVSHGAIVLLIAAIAAPIYIWHRRRKKRLQQELDEKIREIQQIAAEEQKRIQEANDFLQSYLSAIPFHLYNAEKEAFADWLNDKNLVLAFHLTWDEVERLHWLGIVTGKHSVCDLDRVSDEQKKERREAAWNRTKREQSERQKKINAEQKAARLAANPSIQLTPAQIAAKEMKRQEKRQLAEKLKQEQEEQYLKDLRIKGAAAKATYRRTW